MNTEIADKIFFEYQNISPGIMHLSKKYNVSRESIYRLLKRKGVEFKIRYPPVYKYKIDSTYFDNIDTKDKAYFLGLIAADGHYTNDTSKYLTLGLTMEDKYVLQHFINYTKADYPIQISDRSNDPGNVKDKAFIKITNPTFTKNLANLGIHNNKSFSVQIPKLPDHLYSHYIRGYFDGDGWAFLSEKDVRKFCCGFVGHKEMICELQQLLEELGGMYGGSVYDRLMKKGTETCRSLTYNGRNQIRVFHDFIYKDTDETIRMKRKYDNVKKIVDYIS